jgi:hypothetical protein
MNCLSRFFTVTTIFFTLAACAPPIGTLGGSGAAHDFIWAVPNRVVYTIEGYFRPQEDLQVFASYQGVIEPVDISLVTVEVEDLSAGGTIYGPVQTSYQLNTAGRKVIHISYKDMPARYSIEVLSLDESTGNGNGNGNGGGVGVIWAPPPPKPPSQ